MTTKPLNIGVFNSYHEALRLDLFKPYRLAISMSKQNNLLPKFEGDFVKAGKSNSKTNATYWSK